MSSNPIDWTALLALCETMSAPKEEPLTAEGCARRADATMALSTLLSRDYDTIVPALVALVRGLAGVLGRIGDDTTPSGYAYTLPEYIRADIRAALATIPAALRAGVGE